MATSTIPEKAHVYVGTFSATSVGTATEVASLTLPAGVYVVNASVQFVNAFTQYAYIRFAGTNYGNGIVRGTGSLGGGLNISTILRLTSQGTISVVVGQGSGSNQSINQTSFQAVKVA